MWTSRHGGERTTVCAAGAWLVAGALVLLGIYFTEHVWVQASTGRPCRIPEILREPFNALREGRGVAACT